MKKNIIFIFILLYTSLTAEEIQKYKAYYDVNLNFIGKIAEATLNFKTDNNRYLINMNISPYGKLKSLIYNKQISYISEGLINKYGILIPEKYTSVEINDNYILKKRCYFDHLKKEVYVEMSLREKHIFHKFNFNTLKFDKNIEYKNKGSNYFDENYYENDALTYIFNIKNYDIKKNIGYSINAYGLKDNYQGKLKIFEPLNKEKNLGEKYFKNLNKFYKISVLGETINEKKDRIIYLNFDDDFILSDMISEDVIGFGDAKLIRTEIFYNKLKND